MTAIKVPVLEVNMSLYIMVCSNFQKKKKIKKIASRFLKIYVTIKKKTADGATASIKQKQFWVI